MTNELKPEIKSVRELFEEQTPYIVPIYQRNFAWEYAQIEQLVRDVEDAQKEDEKNENKDGYFLGNLIVMKKSDGYEVVDGQQRLTALYLLLSHLGEQLGEQLHEGKLRYQARPRATSTLQQLGKSNDPNSTKDDGIHEGWRTIQQLLPSSKTSAGKNKLFAEYLRDHVKLVRVSLPANTDLNRYFEVMNTRGQQLQPTDIVKARLMSKLQKTDHGVFARIWDACADMDSYVQMTLTPNDTDKRDKIFGEAWSFLGKGLKDFDTLHSQLAPDTSESKKPVESDEPDNIDSLDAAIKQYGERHSGFTEDTDKDRFESIIGFSDFLLHVLNIQLEIGNGELDDKKLIKQFELLNTEDDIKAFASNLLNLRVLFDAYIIKRDRKSQKGDDGDWSLKRLKKSESGKNPTYVNTFDRDDRNNIRDVLLLQSMLRVTYTSPREMDWITEVLQWAAKKPEADTLANQLQNLARKKVHKAFLDGSPPPEYPNLQRIVFNYLDYLLFKHPDYNKPEDFKFTFRSSVEHFYPKNLAETKPIPIHSLHCLGNLALVSASENSHFTDYEPEHKAKKEDIIKKSPKLTEMARITGEEGWQDKQIEDHHYDMHYCLYEDIIKCSEINPPPTPPQPPPQYRQTQQPHPHPSSATDTDSPPDP